MTALKTISYRGGIARFRLPQTWIEEYEPTGGGIFYEEGTDTGTLRINVMDFEKPPAAECTSESARDMLTGWDGSAEVELHASGVAIARSSRTAVENGEVLRIYTWRLGVLVTPVAFRMVVFTYTILARQEQEPAKQQELRLLDKLIGEGEYPAVRGVAGGYTHG